MFAFLERRFAYTLVNDSDQGSAWDGMGRKKSSHGIDILQTIPWDGMIDFLKESHPMGYYEKKFSSHGMGRFSKISVPSHPIQ
jgi:hypothetical protein